MEGESYCNGENHIIALYAIKRQHKDNNWGFCLVHGLMAMELFQETLSKPESAEPEKDEAKKRKNLNSL